MPIYSHSRINTYENCPLQYKLQYIDRIPSDEEGIEAFMGSRVHETLEKLYKDNIHGKINTIDELIEFYNKKWDNEWKDNITITKEHMSADDYRQAGEKAIRGYYKQYHPFNQAQTLWTEKRINFDLGDENYKLIGYIDRVDKTPEDKLEIHDYKASGSLPPQTKFDMDRQLALYQIAIQDLFPDNKNIELVWHYVLFDTEFRSSRTQEQLDELKAEIRALIDTIESDHEFLPKETPLCNWCGYWEYCPHKKHMVDIEEMPVKERKQEEGYVLVDKYAELKAKQKVTGDELEDIKEQLIEYAKEHDVDIVRGTQMKARVSISTDQKLPTKTDDEETYNEIIDMVRDAGVWEQVSSLNGRKLYKDLKEGELPKKLQKKLSDFLVESESKRVTLSRLKEGEE